MNSERATPPGPSYRSGVNNAHLSSFTLGCLCIQLRSLLTGESHSQSFASFDMLCRRLHFPARLTY